MTGVGGRTDADGAVTASVELPFRIISLAELMQEAEAEWLVEDALPHPGLVLLYGAPSVGKTFVALDLALSVAAGMNAFDRATRQGSALYIAAEGHRGLRNRVRAWQTKTGLDPASLPFSAIAEPVDLLNPTVVSALCESVTASKPALIVVDTLARCFGDGDENSVCDMNAFVAACSDISAAADGTILVVHHSGHQGVRARGSSALHGAADTMIRLARNDGPLRLQCTKQKDDEPFAPIRADLRRVAVGDGSRTSCVIDWAASPLADLPQSQQRVLAAILAAGGAAVTQADLQDAAQAATSTVSRALAQLERVGYVTVDRSRKLLSYALTEEGREIAREHHDSHRVSPNSVSFIPPTPPKGGEGEQPTVPGRAAEGGDA